VRNVIGAIQKTLARSAVMVRLAAKVGNQCRAIIHARLNDGRNPERNGEYFLLAHVAPDAKVFVDVGANVGYWTLHFAGLMTSPKYGLLFEPSPESSSRLRANIRGLQFPVEVVEAAAADRVGRMPFFAEPEAGETSSLVAGFSAVGARELEVDVTTVDREIAVRQIDFVDFMKIDAEGFDLKVLIGAQTLLREGRIGIIQFEYNRPWADSGGTLSYAIRMLSDAGYDVYLLKKSGLYRTLYDLHGEYFGYANYVAVSRARLSAVAAIIRSEALI
jgi:FkbM family methyltransferase